MGRHWSKVIFHFSDLYPFHYTNPWYISINKRWGFPYIRMYKKIIGSSSDITELNALVFECFDEDDKKPKPYPLLKFKFIAGIK